VPRERIADTLRLMRKPADATVDAALAREISLRDGGIRALVTGRVEKFDNAYLLSAALVNPADNVTIVSFSEEAPGQEQVLPAAHRLSSRVREALGETLPLIRGSEMSLAKVTTPSLRALQLYTQADALMADEKHGAAEELLKQAVHEDPEFASAYILLAFATNDHRTLDDDPRFPKDDSLPYAQRALELSDKTGERERYFIRGGYFALTDQHGGMLANYQALLALDPDHYWANQNLYSYYRYVWPWGIEDALPYLLRTAQLRPNSFRHISRTAAYLAIEMNRPREAEPYVQRAADLAATDPAARPLYGVAWVRLYPVHRLWMEGDLEGVLNELDRWRETLRSSVVHDYDLVTKVAGFYVVLGMLEAAEEIFRLIDARSGGGEYLLHEVEYYRMDEKEGAEYLMSHGTDAPLGARRLARAGLLSEARKQPDYRASVQATTRWQLSFRNPIPRMSDHQLTQGEVVSRRGQRRRGDLAAAGGPFGATKLGHIPLFPLRRIPGNRMGAARKPRHGPANPGRRLATEEPNLLVCE